VITLMRYLAFARAMTIVIPPAIVAAGALLYPESDNTIMLLFNIIGAGNGAESSPGTYMRLS